ncbi:MAG: hypothetical protein EH225_12155 [Calditrichaeota bacterium]|nr:hypothetical protein [Calditrichota bacterium]RQV99080.1 MAG: hypothetical protein EH225_12155 [Calditrichota bacterium]
MNFSAVFLRLKMMTILGTLLITSTIAYSQSLFYIRNFSQLENLKISYHYPDFQNPLLQMYSDSTSSESFEEIDISDLVKNVHLNQHKIQNQDEEDETTIHPDNYNKKIIESYVKGNYIISIAMLHDEGSFVYGVFKNDILLWKEFEKGFELIAIYPECIGGCLFCGAQFVEEYNSDTINVEFSGKSFGEEWGGRETFIIENDQIYFLMSTRFRKFTPYDRKGNPVVSASSYSTKKFFYNRKGDIIRENFTFDARYPDNTPVLLSSNTDSLKLYDLSINFPDEIPKYVRTISTSRKPVRVGPVHGNYITIFWEGKWFTTYRNNFIFPSSM